MFLRIIFFALFIGFAGINYFAQIAPEKSVPQLIEELKSDNRDLSDSAIEQLANRGEESAAQLLTIAADVTGDQFIRVKAIIVLSKFKDKSSIPTLIKILDEKNSYINGSAAYALSQIGGEEAKNALLSFLKTSLEKNHENLPRAVEAIKELPDSRAFPVLIKILEIAEKQQKDSDSRNKEKDIVRNFTLYYTIEALGEIGNSRASESILKFLNPDEPYTNSRDYLILSAVSKTKGKKSIPLLVSYLEKIVKQLEGKEMPCCDDLGAYKKQIIYNFRLYKQTLDCLEEITKQKSIGSTREDVLMFWRQYTEINNKLKNQN